MSQRIAYGVDEAAKTAGLGLTKLRKKWRRSSRPRIARLTGASIGTKAVWMITIANWSASLPQPQNANRLVTAWQAARPGNHEARRTSLDIPARLAPRNPAFHANGKCHRRRKTLSGRRSPKLSPRRSPACMPSTPCSARSAPSACDCSCYQVSEVRLCEAVNCAVVAVPGRSSTPGGARREKPRLLTRIPTGKPPSRTRGCRHADPPPQFRPR